MFDVLIGSDPALQAWATVFVAQVLQAIPFLALGTLLSAVLAAFVSPDTVAGWCPAIIWWRFRRPAWPGQPYRRASARRCPSPVG